MSFGIFYGPLLCCFPPPLSMVIPNALLTEISPGNGI
jgi:hypothetical protein